MIPYRNRVPNNLHCVGRKQLISLLSIVWKLTTCFYQMVYLCICEIFLKELRASYHQGGRTYMANYLLLLKWILPILQCEPIWFTLFVISIELSYKFHHYTNMKMCTNSFYHVHRTNVSIIPILWSQEFYIKPGDWEPQIPCQVEKYFLISGQFWTFVSIFLVLN